MTDLEMMEIIYKTDGVTYSMALEIVEELKKASSAEPQVVADEREFTEAMSKAMDDASMAGSYTGLDNSRFSINHVMFLAALQAAPVQAQEPRKPTDISQRLREYAGNNGYSHNDYADTMRAAAEEIERYYGGMMNWKATAEARVKELERALSNGTAKHSLLNSASTLGNNEQS